MKDEEEEGSRGLLRRCLGEGVPHARAPLPTLIGIGPIDWGFLISDFGLRIWDWEPEIRASRVNAPLGDSVAPLEVVPRSRFGLGLSLERLLNPSPTPIAAPAVRRNGMGHPLRMANSEWRNRRCG